MADNASRGSYVLGIISLGTDNLEFWEGFKTLISTNKFEQVEARA